MPTKPIIMPSEDGTVSQSANRYPDTFRDQHRSKRFSEGRPWTGWREVSALKRYPDGFVGSDLQPGDHEAGFASAWAAPWVPEFKFFDFNYRTSRIVIRYDRVKAEDTRALREYYAAANRIAAQNGWKSLEFGAPPPFQIESIIGRLPRNPRLAEAAQAGDRWLLGESVEPNPELARILGIVDVGEGIRPASVVETPLAIPPASALAMSAEQLAALVATIVAQTLDARGIVDRRPAARPTVQRPKVQRPKDPAFAQRMADARAAKDAERAERTQAATAGA